ncbi:hypothetical protein, partial [Enterobacter hormaechei]
KRLSNEFVDTIGADPATWAGVAAACVGVSETDGFSAGLAAATFGADVFGIAASGRGGASVCLASFSFAGAGGGALVVAVVAVASAVPPMPTL